MNCECIYYKKDATKEDLMELAKKVESFDCELDPAAVSIMTAKTEVTTDYDHFRKSFNIPKDSMVLFVYGKLHYMSNIRMGNKTYKACFPTDYHIEFTDIEEF